jgi:transposase
MKENQLIEEILGLETYWKVIKIEVDKSNKLLDIFLEYQGKTYLSQEDNTSYPIYDFTEYRRIRHLDFLKYQCYLNFRTPRMKLPNGNVRAIPLGFADKNVSFSFEFETKIIELLLLSKNKTQTAHHAKTTFDIVHQIMKRAVDRGLTKRELEDVKVINLDEKSFRDGQNYFTVLTDTQGKRVLDIIEGRSIESTEELLHNTFTYKKLGGIETVAMDMWKPFMTGVENTLPNAEISHDKFHISKYLNKGVDEVRKQEVKKIDELKNTKYLFLTNTNHWTEKHQLKFEQINTINLETSKAWRLKENFKAIYQGWTREEIQHVFSEWYINVIESEIKPMIKVADTLLRHLKGIIHASISQITNSMAENINSKIQVVKSVARGFKNINGYRNSILFFNGDLNLFPL